MSANAIRVQVGPANYFSFPGAIDKLSEFYPQAALDKALWIYGERALAAAQDYLPKAFTGHRPCVLNSQRIVVSLRSLIWSARRAVIGRS